MKLAAKLVVAFVLGIVLLTAIYAYLAVDREIAMFRQEMAENAMIYAATLEQSVFHRSITRHEEIAAYVRELDQFIDLRNGIDIYDVNWYPLDGNPSTQRAEASTNVVEREISDEHGLRSFTWHDDNGEEMITYLYRAELPSPTPGGLELTTSLAPLHDYTSETVYRAVALMGGMVLVGGLLMALLGVTQVGKPLERLIAKTRKVAEGDLSGPVKMRGFDELSELADSLNQMCIRLQESQDNLRHEAASKIAALEQLRHADRLNTVGRLAAGMAHELGTPLAVVSGRANLIGSGQLKEEDIVHSAETIKAESDRMAKTIRQLLDFARRTQPNRAQADLKPVTLQTAELLRPLAKKRGVDIEFQPPKSAAVANVDVGQIQQVLTNLIVNAVQAMPEGGKVALQLDRVKAEPPEPRDENGGAQSQPIDCYRIAVSDQGIGIPPEDLSQLFEPFFTTKEQGQGTGLGLSISYGIIREHGGWIDVHSTPGSGSRFAVLLPVNSPELPPA